MSDKSYGILIDEWLERQISKMTRDLDFVDNIRICKLKDKEDVKKYEEQRSHGCCGFEDKEVFCWLDASWYRIGCNYGH